MTKPKSALKFEPGDVVQLKSGGPFLTVADYERERDLYECTWFWSGRCQSSRFPPQILVEVETSILRASLDLRSKLSQEAGTLLARREPAEEKSPAG